MWWLALENFAQALGFVVMAILVALAIAAAASWIHETFRRRPIRPPALRRFDDNGGNR
ncbi:MAG TPA: hypothetical protein VKC66_28355 [Xanthobacteraceae bacterium]|nr:hypothetical protein [Xanthobacteraceae bacterium]